MPELQQECYRALDERGPSGCRRVGECVRSGVEKSMSGELRPMLGMVIGEGSPLWILISGERDRDRDRGVRKKEEKYTSTQT